MPKKIAVEENWEFGGQKRKYLENPGIDPGTSRMLSGRSALHKVS